jgi:hypothetical protein
MTTNGQVRGTFSVSNDIQVPREIEIALESINVFEAKFGICKECLNFGEFSNFDGARLGYKGCPIILIKLTAAINVDVLLDIQHFEFTRKFSRQERTHQVCRETLTQGTLDEGVRIIKIDGIGLI